MGLAASQARLMMLTSKKCDIEYLVQNINNRRLRVSYQTSKLATYYSDALNNKIVEIKKPDGTSVGTTASNIYDFAGSHLKTIDGKRVVDKATYDAIHTSYAFQDFGSFIYNHIAADYWKFEDTSTRSTRSVSQQLSTVNTLLDQFRILRDGYKSGMISIDPTKMAEKFNTENKIMTFMNDMISRLESLKVTINAPSSTVNGNNTAFDAMESEMERIYGTPGVADCFRVFMDPLQSYDERYQGDGTNLGWDKRRTTSDIVAATIKRENIDFVVMTQDEIQAGLLNNTLVLEGFTDGQSKPGNVVQRLYTEDDDSATATYEAALAPLQAQDKKLELDLKNLETQRSAITTELDAVKKIIDDNIGKTFKIFAG